MNSNRKATPDSIVVTLRIPVKAFALMAMRLREERYYLSKKTFAKLLKTFLEEVALKEDLHQAASSGNLETLNECIGVLRSLGFSSESWYLDQDDLRKWEEQISEVLAPTNRAFWKTASIEQLEAASRDRNPTRKVSLQDLFDKLPRDSNEMVELITEQERLMAEIAELLGLKHPSGDSFNAAEEHQELFKLRLPGEDLAWMLQLKEMTPAELKVLISNLREEGGGVAEGN